MCPCLVPMFSPSFQTYLPSSDPMQNQSSLLLFIMHIFIFILRKVTGMMEGWGATFHGISVPSCMSLAQPSPAEIKRKISETSCDLLICSQWLRPQRALPELEVVTPTLRASGP